MPYMGYYGIDMYYIVLVLPCVLFAFWGSQAAVALANTNWLLVVIFAVCVVLLQKFKMNPIWVMVLAGVIKTVVSLIVNVF